MTKITGHHHNYLQQQQQLHHRSGQAGHCDPVAVAAATRSLTAASAVTGHYFIPGNANISGSNNSSSGAVLLSGTGAAPVVASSTSVSSNCTTSTKAARKFAPY